MGARLDFGSAEVGQTESILNVLHDKPWFPIWGRSRKVKNAEITQKLFKFCRTIHFYAAGPSKAYASVNGLTDWLIRGY